MYYRSEAQIEMGETLICASKGDSTSEPHHILSTPKPVVQGCLYPITTKGYNVFEKAVTSLCVNDSSVTVDSINSVAFGKGLSLGFLGSLQGDSAKMSRNRPKMAKNS